MQSILKRSLWWVETMIVVIVLAMVLLTFSDVIGRRIFGTPIYGANDITEHLMGLMVFAGLPIVTAVGAHLSVDLLGKVLDHPALRIWGIVTGLAVAVILGLIAWLFFQHAQNAVHIREVSQALNFPRAPLYLYFSASCALSCVIAVLTTFGGVYHLDALQSSEEIL